MQTDEHCASKSADPDVPIRDWFAGVAVTLQTDGAVTMRTELRKTYVLRCTDDGCVVLHDHTIENDRHDRTGAIGSVCLESRGGIDDIIDIPFARLSARIDERSRLLVDAGRLTVDIGLIVVAIQNLYFIAVLQIDAAIAPALSATVYVLGNHPLDVKLEVAKGFPGDDITCGLDDLSYPFVYNIIAILFR